MSADQSIIQTFGARLRGDALTAAAVLPTDFVILAQLTAQGDTVVADIAGLKALTIADYASGHKVWVQTKKAWYVVDRAAATVAGDDNFYVAPTVAGGMYARVLAPVPEWQAKAVNGTGFYMNPTSGNDDAAGDVGTPIKSTAEFCARMFGAAFTSVSPRLHVAGDGSTNLKDAVFQWFSTTISTPLLIIGEETVVAAGVVLSAAVAQAYNVSQGILTSTITDFQTNGYVSTTTRTLWARRVNTVATSTTYAPLYRTHNSGGNFSVDIGIQDQLNTTTFGSPVPTTQAFAAGDTIDLVSLPVLPGIVAHQGIFFRPSRVDLMSGAQILGSALFGVTGFRGACSLQVGFVGLTSAIVLGTYTSQWNTRSSLAAVVIGAQGIAATINAQGAVLINGFSMDTGTISAQIGAAITIQSNAWIQNVTQAFTVDTSSSVTCPDTIFIGVGPSVVNAVKADHGGRFIGSKQFYTALNNFTAGQPWQVGSRLFSTAELREGKFDNDSMAAIAGS